MPRYCYYSTCVKRINTDEKFKNEIIKYSAGCLRDFTRIASSDPLMWKDIFIDNSENIINRLNSFPWLIFPPFILFGDFIFYFIYVYL